GPWVRHGALERVRQFMAVSNIGKTAGKLTVVVIGMFAFVFVVMVPLYDTLCDVLGINGKYAQRDYEVSKAVVDESRLVTVSFVASNAEGMPWEFRPVQTTVKVHPGAVINVDYYAKNVTD